LYDLDNRKWGLQIPLSTSGEIAFHPDGKLLAAGDNQGEIALFNTKTGKRRATLAGHNTAAGSYGTNPVTSLQFSPDGRWLASLSRDPFLIVWDIATGQPAAVYEHKRDFSFLGGTPQLSWFWDSKWLALPVIGGEIRILGVMESEFV
jgi:WD40 repeat protein